MKHTVNRSFWILSVLILASYLYTFVATQTSFVTPPSITPPAQFSLVAQKRWVLSQFLQQAIAQQNSPLALKYLDKIKPLLPDNASYADQAWETIHTQLIDTTAQAQQQKMLATLDALLGTLPPSPHQASPLLNWPKLMRVTKQPHLSFDPSPARALIWSMKIALIQHQYQQYHRLLVLLSRQLNAQDSLNPDIKIHLTNLETYSPKPLQVEAHLITRLVTASPTPHLTPLSSNSARVQH